MIKECLDICTGKQENKTEQDVFFAVHALHVNQSRVKTDTGNTTGSAGRMRARIKKAIRTHS